MPQYNEYVNKFFRLIKKLKRLFKTINSINIILILLFCFFILLIFNDDKNVAIVTKTENVVETPVLKSTFNISENEIAKIYSTLKNGGIRSIHSKYENVAIIVPYRNRAEHLEVFLRTIHYFLNEQPINYGIFVVEQISNQTFNKAKLMNAGFMEISKNPKWDCFIFHDVDLLPENKNNTYKCDKMPIHFSSAVDKLAYQIRPFLFGGVTGMRKKYFQKINGYSNEFWGWGGEDEAMAMRIQLAGDKFDDVPVEFGRYQMHKHGRDTNNAGKGFKCLLKLLDETSFYYKKDGLSNLRYKLLFKKTEHLFTHLFFDLLEKESIVNKLFKC